MVGILIDASYADSLWCKNLYESLTKRLREKRISFCEVFDNCPASLDAVFVIASDIEWTKSAVKQLNGSGLTPILICNQSESLPGCIYSCVCSDINASMKNLLENLKLKERSNIALYGFNTESISDTGRVDSLFVWRKQDFHKMQVFTNNGSLQKCFDEFFTHINDFDAAICANDFAAVSLMRNLEEKAPEKLKDFYIISCAQTRISSYFREHILSLDMNFEQYGKAAVYIYEALLKHSYLSEMTVKVVWSLESGDNPPKKRDATLLLPHKSDCFYKDPELSEMLIVDKLLTLSDETEKKILQGLIEDKTYEQLSEDCFLTVGSVKYRIKKLLADSGATDKQQIKELLIKYIK